MGKRAFQTIMLDPHTWDEVYCPNCLITMQVPIHSGRTFFHHDWDSETSKKTIWICPYCKGHTELSCESWVYESARFPTDKDQHQIDWLKQTKELHFNHPYLKLNDTEYTTIKGATHFKKHGIVPGGWVQPMLNKRPYRGLMFVQWIKVVVLKHIGLDMLQRDGNHLGFTIHTSEDFLTFINSSRRSNKLTEDSLVCVYFLKRKQEGKNNG